MNRNDCCGNLSININEINIVILEEWLIKILKEKIPFEINSIQFVEREGNRFLDIELPDHDMKTIEEKTKIISKIIDEFDDYYSNNYYLNIYSSGTEKEINLNDLDKLLNNYLNVKTTKNYFNKNSWDGILIENNLDNIVFKINNKGRFQKLTIKKQDISFAKTTAKIRKEK